MYTMHYNYMVIVDNIVPFDDIYCGFLVFKPICIDVDDQCVYNTYFIIKPIN